MYGDTKKNKRRIEKVAYQAARNENIIHGDVSCVNRDIWPVAKEHWTGSSYDRIWSTEVTRAGLCACVHTARYLMRSALLLLSATASGQRRKLNDGRRQAKWQTSSVFFCLHIPLFCLHTLQIYAGIWRLVTKFSVEHLDKSPPQKVTKKTAKVKYVYIQCNFSLKKMTLNFVIS